VNSSKSFTVTAESVGKRLDHFLTAAMNISRSQIQRLVKAGGVTVAGRSEPVKYQIREGEVIQLTLPEARPSTAQAEDIPLDIIFEDKHLLVVDKPAGLVVHPAAGHLDHTLVNALLHHCGRKLKTGDAMLRPGIVHRLDKDTTGCLVVAKTDKAFVSLQEQISLHSAGRTYQALVWGVVKEEEGSIDAPIGRSQGDRKKMTVRQSGGKESVTHFKVLERLPAATLLEIRLETGRTHQIRVHLSSIGYPVVGDHDYGTAPGKVSREFLAKLKKVLDRQALHASKLKLVHPVSGKTRIFEAPLPADFRRAYALLKKM
jgi:23S rRNA pseudouridine1911/1915/1917 synthase